MADSALARSLGRRSSLSRAEGAFGLRLVLTLVVTLSAIAAAQYFLTGPRLIDTALENELERFRRDAAGLQEIYGDESYGQWEGARAALGMLELSVIEHMGYRRDVQLARLISSDGIVASAAMSDTLESSYVDANGAVVELDGITARQRIDDVHGKIVEQVLASGEATVRPEPLPQLGATVYHVPVELDGFPYVFEVITDNQVIEDQQRSLRRLIGTMLAVGALLGMPVFYLAGGRGLHRRHATAVRQSSRDPLTGLGNHRGFQEQARRETESASRHSHKLALALIDLDDFKAVNDTSGHRVGDEVLAEMGRILASGRPEDQAFRVGGDEFALLLPFTDLGGARAACERLREQVERANRGVTLSIGLAEAGRGCRDSDSLWEQADVALYEAKRSGRNRVVAFADLDSEQTSAASAKGSALQRLLAEGRMGAAFQPIWDLGSSALLGFEALARPPAGCGLDSPAELFDAADRLGRVAEIDDLCRRAIFDAVGDLPDRALLFINLAPAALGHPLAAAEHLATMAAEARLRTDRVVLELTERTAVRRSVMVREISHLQAMGFKIAIDDVGAGNAGLELLRQAPFDFVKIDRTVVVAALNDTNARAVLLAVVTYANETGAYVIAEGIEERAQLSFLRRLPDREDRALHQIRGAQGYLLGRPGALTASLQAFQAGAPTA